MRSAVPLMAVTVAALAIPRSFWKVFMYDSSSSDVDVSCSAVMVTEWLLLIADTRLCASSTTTMLPASLSPKDSRVSLQQRCATVMRYAGHCLDTWSLSDNTAL